MHAQKFDTDYPTCWLDTFAGRHRDSTENIQRQDRKAGGKSGKGELARTFGLKSSEKVIAAHLRPSLHSHASAWRAGSHAVITFFIQLGVCCGTESRVYISAAPYYRRVLSRPLPEKRSNPKLPRLRGTDQPCDAHYLATPITSQPSPSAFLRGESLYPPQVSQRAKTACRRKGTGG